MAVELNASIENIGARRLHTILERILEDVSYHASDRSGEKITIDRAFVQKHIGELSGSTDLSRFIL
jgi:ATP-dependent HslUV protease ATP-binding subunit HslU